MPSIESELPPVLDDRYEVGALLGAGGQAAVFEGFQLSTGRPVAIKVGLEERASVSNRMRREAMHLARVDHPNVVSIYDSGTTASGKPYLVLERLIGQTLFDEIDGKPMSPTRAVRLVIGALDGLQAVHEAGLVHRDVKPENLFLSAPGTIDEKMSLLDFGIAVSETDARLTRAGELVGTPQYLAPEMSLGPDGASPATDVYQMALVLTEMLTGSPVCRGSARDCILQHQAGVKVPRGLPGPLAKVLDVALARDPSRRFSSARALRVKLAETLRRPPARRSGGLAVLGLGAAVFAGTFALVVGAGTFGGLVIAVASDAGATERPEPLAPIAASPQARAITGAEVAEVAPPAPVAVAPAGVADATPAEAPPRAPRRAAEPVVAEPPEEVPPPASTAAEPVSLPMFF